MTAFSLARQSPKLPATFLRMHSSFLANTARSYLAILLQSSGITRLSVNFLRQVLQTKSLYSVPVVLNKTKNNFQIFKMMKLNLLFSSNTLLEGTSSLHQSIWFCTSAVLQVASPLLRVASRLSTVESVSCITILEGKIHLSPFWSFYVLYPVLLGPAPQDWDASLIGKPDISLSQGGFNSSVVPADIGAERQPFKDKKN